MSLLHVVPNEIGTLVVDSRLIAEQLDIEHRALLQTIDKHLDRLERKTKITFELIKSERGKPERFAWLNKRQATFLMTLSRNSDPVLDAKEALIDAFEKAEQLLRDSVEAPKSLPDSKLAEFMAIALASGCNKEVALEIGAKHFFANAEIESAPTVVQRRFHLKGRQAKVLAFLEMAGEPMSIPEIQLGLGQIGDRAIYRDCRRLEGKGEVKEVMSEFGVLKYRTAAARVANG